MVQAIFLDVDGTLISFETHQVPAASIEAIRRVRELGVKVIIASGRPASDLHEIDAVPYDAVVALNGSECVLRDGTYISRQLIPEASFRRALELSEQYGFVLALETNEGVFVNKMQPVVKELARLVAHPVPEVVDIERMFMEKGCSQLCIYCDEPTERKVMAELPDLAASRWIDLFADVNVKGISKASGMEEMARHFGFDLAETIAFGDGGNDIPMLRRAGIGVAMGNASDRVKAEADYVTDSVDDGGLPNVLRHFFGDNLK